MKASSSRSGRGARRGSKRGDQQRRRRVLAREASAIGRRLERAVRVNPAGPGVQRVLNQCRRAVYARNPVTRSAKPSAEPTLAATDVQRSPSSGGKDGLERRKVQVPEVHVAAGRTRPPKPRLGIALPCLADVVESVHRRIVSGLGPSGRPDASASAISIPNSAASGGGAASTRFSSVEHHMRGSIDENRSRELALQRPKPCRLRGGARRAPESRSGADHARGDGEGDRASA